MNREDIMLSVSSGMPERRWIHTLGVMSTARQLAEQYGEDADRAELAEIHRTNCNLDTLAMLCRMIRAELVRRRRIEIRRRGSARRTACDEWYEDRAPRTGTRV